MTVSVKETEGEFVGVTVREGELVRDVWDRLPVTDADSVGNEVGDILAEVEGVPVDEELAECEGLGRMVDDGVAEADAE